MATQRARFGRARLEHYVWALAAIALVSAGSVGWIFHRLLDDVANRRDRTTAGFDAGRDSVAEMHSLVFAARSDIDHLLRGTGVPMLLDYQHGRDAIDRCRGLAASANAPRAVSDALQPVLNDLAVVLDRAYRSKVASGALEIAAAESARIARKRIGEFHAAVEVLAGASRLRHAAAWADASIREGAHTPTDPHEESSHTDFSNVRSEVADLTNLTLRLSLERDLDNMVDIRDNGITQSLKRLRRMLGALGPECGAHSGVDEDAVRRIERAVLGDGESLESLAAREPTPEFGFYNLRRLSLEQDALQLELVDSSNRASDRVRERLESLAEAHRVAFVEGTRDTGRALQRAQRLMGGIAVSTLVLFLVVSAWMSNAIREQVRTLHGTLEKLHASNEAHEEASRQVSVLTAAMHAASSPILIADRDSRVGWINDAYCDLMGWHEADVIGSVRDVRSVISPSSPSASDVHALLSIGRTWKSEGSCTREAGEPRVGSQTVTPLLDRHGVLANYVSIVHDVTDERRAADALRASHDETSLVLRSVASVLVGFGADGRVRRWSPQAEEVLGAPAVPAVGAWVADLGLSWDSNKVQGAVTRCLASRAEVRLEDVPFVRPTSGPGVLAISLNPMRDERGELCGCVLLGRDITERRHLEQQLTRAQKLESIGQLAAGIAHEINTPTQFISDNTVFVRDSIHALKGVLEAIGTAAKRVDGAVLDAATLDAIAAEAAALDLDFILSEIPRALDDSVEGLARIRNIVQAMKQFSHPGTGRMDPADLNQIVRVTSTVARNEWKYTALLELDLDPNLPPFPCYEQDLGQVVLNMIVNAAHAIAERKDKPAGTQGHITIRTAREGDVAILRITDDGGGIPESIRHRVFDPFFTTKDVGRGTGQGLAIAHAVVVDKHGGTIGLESEVGRGTTFTIRLPMSSPILPATNESEAQHFT